MICNINHDLKQSINENAVTEKLYTEDMQDTLNSNSLDKPVDYNNSIE